MFWLSNCLFFSFWSRPDICWWSSYHLCGLSDKWYSEIKARGDAQTVRSVKPVELLKHQYLICLRLSVPGFGKHVCDIAGKVQLVPAFYVKSRKSKKLQRAFLAVFWSGKSRPHGFQTDPGLQDCLMLWVRVCSELSMLCHPSAAQARTELLKWFSVLPPLPCFYWPRWMLQRGNQMWDRDDLKGQVINIICLNFLILMGWCLRCWPQGGGKHDPLDLKWEQSKGFQAWESSATPVKCLILCVCMWTLSGNSLFQQQVLLTFFPLSKSTNAIFILDVSFSF